MSEPRTLTVDELVALLAPAVGQDKAREAVESAVRALGTAHPDAVLTTLAADPGVLGAAARYARVRAARLSGTSMTTATPPSRPKPAPTISALQIVELLTPSLGEEKAHDVVIAAVQRRGTARDGIDYAQALEVLDDLAREQGIVGVTARFAKARLILLFQR